MTGTDLSWIAADGPVVRLVLGEPIMTSSLLAALSRVLAELPPSPVVIESSHPRIFLAGAHLGEIASLDAVTSRDYASRGRHLMSRLGSHPAPVVAAVNGRCAGGGFDLVLSCDAIVAGPGATFAHPGVGRGLVTGWGGTLALRRRAPPALTARVLLEGEPLPPAALAAAGLVRPVVTEPTLAATVEAARLAALHPSRLRLWRSFRAGRFVDSFRAFVVHNE